MTYESSSQETFQFAKIDKEKHEVLNDEIFESDVVSYYLFKWPDWKSAKELFPSELCENLHRSYFSGGGVDVSVPLSCGLKSIFFYL